MVSADQIDALLPQTQCRKCGYNGCKPYATAMAAGEALPNRCSPGGEQTIAALAELLHQPILSIAADVLPTLHSYTAFIDEDRCIGCALCLKACPVDAIVGSGKLMHTVIPNDCTGCDLCIPSCPVDCISLIPKQELAKDPTPAENRQRYLQHQQRYENRAKSTLPPVQTESKADAIKAALERVAKK